MSANVFYPKVKKMVIRTGYRGDVRLAYWYVSVPGFGALGGFGSGSWHEAVVEAIRIFQEQF